MPSCSSHQAPERRLIGRQVREHVKKAVGEKLKEKLEELARTFSVDQMERRPAK